MFDPILYISRLSGATKVYDIDNQSCSEDMQSPRGPRVLPFFVKETKIIKPVSMYFCCVEPCSTKT